MNIILNIAGILVLFLIGIYMVNELQNWQTEAEELCADNGYNNATDIHIKGRLKGVECDHNATFIKSCIKKTQFNKWGEVEKKKVCEWERFI